MFISKKKPNFRRRVDDADDVGVDEKASAGGGVGVATAGGLNGNKKEKGKEKPKSLPGGGATSLLSFGGDDGEAEGASIAATKKKEKPKSRISSFGEDEEGEDGRVLTKGRKGLGTGQGPGHKLGSVKGTKEPSAKVPISLQTSAGEYTKEKLEELARNTRSLVVPRKPPPPPPKPTESASEPVVVLKGLLKPPSLEPARAGQGLVSSDHLAARTSNSNQLDVQTEMENRLGLMGIGRGAEPGGITHIPDAAAIAAAKAKRERLRQAQAAPDYIPIAGGGEMGRPDRSRYRESGLVREQEDDLEEKEERESSGEDDDAGRMVFVGDGGKAKKRGERRGRRVTKDAAADGVASRETKGGVGEEAASVPGLGTGGISEISGAEGAHALDEEDEEALRWEEEQLRKGVGKRVEEVTQGAGREAASSRPATSGAAAGGLDFRTGVSRGAAYEGMGGAGMWAYGRIEAQSAAQQGQAVMKSLRDGVERLREAHMKSHREVERAEGSLVQAAENVLALEGGLAEAGEKYRFVQELKDYVTTLCDFLRDKAPLIEELEEEIKKVYEDRAQALAERRAADNADEMAEAEAAMAAAFAAMGRGAGTVTAAAAAKAAAEAVRDGTGVAPQLDEFGRDVNMQKRLEAKRRQEARERRKARAAARRGKAEANGGLPNGAPAAVEGESSSDESESEQTAYVSARQKVLAVADGVFGDAAEEFANLTKVKQRFESWKLKYPVTYRDAYCSLSTPTLFSPYVRLELLRWDPLYGNAGFDSMNWYNLLFDYGVPSSSGGEANPDDPDMNLVPRLVEKVALPMLRHSLATCWDPFSQGGTARAVAALQEVFIYVPVESESLQEVLADVKKRLTDTIAKTQVPAWTPAVLAAVPSAGRLAAHLFGAALRLLRNVAAWREVLARPLLDQLALEALVARQILPHLRSLLPTPHDALARTERLLAALKTLWIGPSVAGQISPELSPLVSYINMLAHTLESRREAGGSSDEFLGLARRVKRMLVDLNEYDKARTLAKRFQLREAM